MTSNLRFNDIQRELENIWYQVGFNLIGIYKEHAPESWLAYTEGVHKEHTSNRDECIRKGFIKNTLQNVLSVLERGS